ncbi:MAG: hypothetical protein KGS45_01615 [Planctomycetes bacterium]|nr:hypothetical protein [Planctomycetota bacterium]
MRTSCMVAALAAGVIASTVWGQQIAPFYQGCYTIRDLGAPPGVPANLGGINFLPGNPNVMLIGGAANGGTAELFTIAITRGAGNVITGFSGSAAVYCSAPNLDGGLAIAPNNTIFVATYPTNLMHQILPGSSAPNVTTSLNTIGISGTTGTCQFVPPGFPGAGRFKVATYGGGEWFDVPLTPDGTSGLFTLGTASPGIFIGGGPEGIVFVGAGNPAFPVASTLVSEYGFGQVASYQLDSNGDPIPSTRRAFVTGLGGAEGGVRDPLTGNFLFSTFGGGNRVLVVEGFNLDCRANINGDCAVDFFDYLDFVASFSANDPSADYNRDEVIDFFDYLDFVADFSSGCV